VAVFRRQLTQLSQTRVELFFRALADAAGVDDHDVRVCRVPGRLVAGLLEEARHPLRIVDVHLAAERLDQVFLGQFTVTFAFAVDFRFRLSPQEREPTLNLAGRPSPQASHAPTVEGHR
jgi:hypothetical protein